MKRSGSKRRKTVAAAVAAAMLATSWALPASADKATETPAAAGAAAEGSAGNAGSGGSAGAGTSTDATGKSDEKPAAGAMSKEQAEKLLRQYVNIPKDYALQSATSGTSKLANGARSYWSLDFVKKANGKQLGSIHASLDAESGQLLSFNEYTNQGKGGAPTYPLKVNREAAIGLAETFIGQVAEPYSSGIKLNETFGINLLPPLTGDVIHQLRFDRVVNGVTFPANYIQVDMDSEGRVNRYEVEWDDSLTFPTATGTISAEEAEKEIRETAVPELHYTMAHGPQLDAMPQLSYRLGALAIDAKTGERSEGLVLDGYRNGTASEEPLTDKPLGTKPKPGKLTEAEAIEAVKKAFALPDDFKLEAASYLEYMDEATGKMKAGWELNWNIEKDGRQIGSAWANVNGDTGHIQSFYQYGKEPAQGTTGITLAEAMAKASEAVKKQLPWLTDELHIIKPRPEQYEGRNPEEINSYSISFQHRVFGAIVDYDNVSVGIDARTGAVQSFEAYVHDIAYPAKKPAVIAAADAVDKFLDFYDIKLQYRLNQMYWWDGQPIPMEKVNVLIAAGEASDEELQAKTSVDLVYQLSPKPVHESIYLDAVTGEWRSEESGEPTTLELPRATDAEGHWAEQALQLMVAYKALDLEEGKVRPNQAITRGELIKMLVLASSGGRFGYAYETAAGDQAAKASFADVSADSAYFAYVENALDNGLIDVGDGSFNPEGKVSRDEMAELIVRALGYNSLANVDPIFKASFKDEAQIANKGQAAIVVGLKIMSLSNGYYLPEKQVTRAEASIAFYRYLQKRAELKEQPLRM